MARRAVRFETGHQPARPTPGEAVRYRWRRVPTARVRYRRQSRARRRLRACVARLSGIVTLLLLAAACSDDGTGDATTTPSEPSATAIESTTTEPTTTAAAAIGDPLVGIGEVELVAEGYQFTEGPQWMADDGVLLFTDFAGPIYQLGPDDDITEFRFFSDGANGLAVDTEGRLLAAERDTRRVTRTESDGTVTPIAEQFEGVPLNQPNDIAVRSDGTIYFTDPYYGDRTTDLDFHGVFRIAADGSLSAERRGAMSEQPNGIALSPDEGRLYVSNEAANVVWVFDVADDGSLSEARTFVTTSDGPDGMTVDAAGNLFVTTGSGIEVFAPDGTLWGKIPVPPGWAANCAFGGADGRTLYITAGEGLYRVTLAHPGPY
jgi:gluconolactonase